MKDNRSEILDRVIRTAGGVKAIAHELKVSPSAVSQWKAVPANHLYRVAKMTSIPAQEIRPDLF